jgi:hypothetical protein
MDDLRGQLCGTIPLAMAKAWQRPVADEKLRAILVLLQATPAGFERTENSAKDDEDSPSPTEKPPAEASTRRMTTRSGSMAAKLAVLAANAVWNWDLARAIELLEQIRTTCDGEAPPADLHTVRGGEGKDRG